MFLSQVLVNNGLSSAEAPDASSHSTEEFAHRKEDDEHGRNGSQGDNQDGVYAPHGYLSVNETYHTACRGKIAAM